MTDLDELPNGYGHCIFCDDIRDEVGGKKSYMGVYSSTLFVGSPFPLVLGKFGIAVTLIQKREYFIPNATFQIFLPGEESPTYAIEAKEEQPGAALRGIAQGVAPSDTGKPPSPLIKIQTGLIVSPLVLKQEGDIRVYAVVSEKSIRLGRLQVRLSKRGVELTEAEAKGKEQNGRK